MTALHSNPRGHVAPDAGESPSESRIESVARLCKSAVGGRRASRALAAWTKRFAISESEFHVLWELRSAAGDGVDQTTLAGELAFSPALVSATVERLRARDLICLKSAPGDRRRNLWQLSSNGRTLVDDMLAAAALLRCDPLPESQRAATTPTREAAA